MVMDWERLAAKKSFIIIIICGKHFANGYRLLRGIASDYSATFGQKLDDNYMK